MNRHFRGSEEAVRSAICNWIEEQYDLECFDPADWIDLEYAPLSQLDDEGHRHAQIDPEHPLWDYLDDESQEAQRQNKSQNYLIWKGDPRKDQKVIVTHFGPFSAWKKIQDFKEKLRGLMNEFRKEHNSLGIFKKEDFLNMDSEEEQHVAQRCKNLGSRVALLPRKFLVCPEFFWGPNRKT